jgi:hypothetical protein
MTNLNARKLADQPSTYEVWYLTWNDPKTGCGYWLRYVVEAPTHAAPYGELWFARFDPKNPARTFGIHRRFDRIQDSPLRIGDAIFDGGDGTNDGECAAVGSVEGDGHTISWGLRWTRSESPITLFPDLAYRFGIGETTFVTPNPRVPMSGELEIDGERVTFDGVLMGQSHLWGKKHAYAWAWAHCSDFDDAPGAVLEFLAARMHRRGVTLPPLVMARLDLDGEKHELNQFRHVARNRASFGGTRLDFTAKNATFKIQGSFTCEPHEMVVAPYLDPDGTEVFCSNTEIGTVRLTISRRSGLGWREHRTLIGERRGHFEVGGRLRDPAVTREHILVG